MSSTSFSFHFLPEEDRLALTFHRDEGEIPAPILLTRRLVKLLGDYLRQHIEKNTSLPEAVTADDKDDIFQFMHQSELEANPPTWDSQGRSQETQKTLQGARLATKIDIQHTENGIQLLVYRKSTQLLSLSLGWKELHSFLYSLAELSKKADWRLEDTFEWSGAQTLAGAGGNAGYLS